MSARLVQNVVNQVVVASSSSAAEAWVEESSELDVASELELSVLELSVLEPELVEAAATVFAGAAVPLPELQPATSNPPAASTLIQDERFKLSLAFRAGAPPARFTVVPPHHHRPKEMVGENCGSRYRPRVGHWAGFPGGQRRNRPLPGSNE